MILKDKRILVTGGTGSLGKVLVRRLLSGSMGMPRKIIIFSRDEAKQHFMRTEYQRKKIATDEVIYQNFEQILEFRIGDVRDYHSVCAAIRDADVVVNAAALKQVPTCEYFPFEATRTNIGGAENIVRAIREHNYPIETVVGVSTDKACKPVNVMGMTKAIQEKIFISANLRMPETNFVCVRYGNVMASRGSVIPLFHEQIKSGGPVTVTTTDMTRFLLSLERAVDTIFGAMTRASRGGTFVPKVPAARIVDVASVLIGDRKIKQMITGIRPGEKIHEIMVSDEEAWRTIDHGDYYEILPMLPELCKSIPSKPALTKEYSSSDTLLNIDQIRALMESHRLMVGQEIQYEGEFLR